MAFYAFSPLGGGLLTKPLLEIANPAKGSPFDAMVSFGDIYLTDDFLPPLKTIHGACDPEVCR